jgi:hypothetical protein
MKTLYTLHRYLSCLVAPAMIFFAVSGIWQVYRLQESKKDGSYTAPWTLSTLSHVHMAEKLKGPAAPWFKAAMSIISGMFILAGLAGIAMALRSIRPAWVAWACLATGALIPFLLALAAATG